MSTAEQPPEPRKKKKTIKTGLLFLVMAVIAWGAILINPFLHFTTGQKGSLVGAAFIVGEIFFWLTAILMGREAFERLKNKWRKQAPKDE